MLLKQLLTDMPILSITGSDEIEISDIIYDSRKVVPGCVFVCLVGSQVDSHRFAAQAVRDGAAAVVISHPAETGGRYCGYGGGYPVCAGMPFRRLFWPSSRQDEDGGDHRDQRKDHGFLYDQIHPGTGGESRQG